MTRLINADALKREWIFTGDNSKGYRDAIDEAPTVDAVPVIRCKDCKYYQQGSRNSDDWLWCMMNHHYTDEEKYCAWAERKEE